LTGRSWRFRRDPA